VHRIRVQVREDGLTIDQILLSRATSDTATPPGATKNDGTIYPEQNVEPIDGAPPPPPPPPPCGPLPSGWGGGDIGNVAAGGESCYSSTAAEFTVRGSGADIWGKADEFQFAHTQLTGDGTITVHVASLTNIDAWTKSGVMMRDTLSAGSKHAAMYVSPAMGLAFQRRLATGGLTTHTGASGAAPQWLRLNRTGNVFTAYSSTDGIAWATVGSETIVMNPTISVGMPVTSHADGSVAAAVVDHVSVTTP
jgi:hypothetical protein